MSNKGRKIELKNSDLMFLRTHEILEYLNRYIYINEKGNFTGLHKLLSNFEFLYVIYLNIKKAKNDVWEDYVNLIDVRDDNVIDIAIFKELAKQIHTGLYNLQKIDLIYNLNYVIQESIKVILEFIYNPLFQKNLYWSRYTLNCDMALNFITKNLNTLNWIINENFKVSFYTNINYNLLITFLMKNIDDKPFFDLLWKFFKSDLLYKINFDKCAKINFFKEFSMEQIFLNIYLYKFDLYLTKMQKFFNEKKDKDLKKLFYFRYDYEFIIGIEGSEYGFYFLKNKIKMFLKNEFYLIFQNFKVDTNIKVYDFKKLVISFLGMNIIKSLKKFNNNNDFFIKILIPNNEVIKKLKLLNFIKEVNQKLRPTRSGWLIHYDLFEIIKFYNNIYIGLCNYYLNSCNKKLLLNYYFFLKYSLILTIAIKMKIKTKKKMFLMYGKNITVKKNDQNISFINSTFWKDNVIRNKITFKKSILDLFDKIKLI